MIDLCNIHFHKKPEEYTKFTRYLYLFIKKCCNNFTIISFNVNTKTVKIQHFLYDKGAIYSNLLTCTMIHFICKIRFTMDEIKYFYILQMNKFFGIFSINLKNNLNYSLLLINISLIKAHN